MNGIDFDSFDSTDFEEFCFELLKEAGFVNIDWRKGTGLAASPADGGRDIVAQLEQTDIDGTKRFEKWFFDCKHYKKGVPPEKLQSLLAWSSAERPDCAVFMLSSFLSNPSKDFLRNYEINNHPAFRIKYWEKPVITRLADGKEEFLRRFFFDLPRTENDILAAEQEFFDRVWYGRKLVLEESRGQGRNLDIPKDIIAGMKKAMKEAEDRYGKDSLGPYSDFEWGMINGKLSALRWVLGDEWDMLDT